MLNAGVIGMGVGLNHAMAYINHNQVTLKTICDFDQKKLIYFKNHYGLLMETNDQSILQDKDIDIVSIASYDNYHSSQILQALNNEKHVIAEKPLCLSQDEMNEIYAVHKKSNDIQLSANHVLRSNPRFIKFKNDVNKSEFGKIVYIEGDYYWGRKNKLFGWRSEMDFYSIILGAAVHMIDLVMWLLNMRPASVQAVGNDIASNNSNMKFNSFAAILLNFDNGVIAKLTGNGGCVHPHFHGLKIFGTERTAIHNLTGAYFLNSSEPGSKPITISEPYPEKEEREKVIHSFVDSILDPSVKPIVPQQDVYDVMSVCFAAEEAMNTGQTVNIEYLG